MINILFIILTLAALALTVFYGVFYEVSSPGATYHQTYAWLSLLAAIIFGGLFYAGKVNREKVEPNVLLD